MRDVLLGFLSYVLGIGALIGTMLLCHYLFGPPMADRARSFAFNAGGGLLMFAVTVVLCTAGMLYASTQR